MNLLTSEPSRSGDRSQVVSVRALETAAWLPAFPGQASHPYHEIHDGEQDDQLDEQQYQASSTDVEHGHIVRNPVVAALRLVGGKGESLARRGGQGG